ncbi:MerR family transcriptional regulator [Mesorhizobium loti]|nr:MerR family transcriptional regulator [Mesorhizobium loti]PLP56558.1 MerR family transcriptional regulator [Mesorhizobium loti]
MEIYTVSELAELAGISVRTLHHYDEIGLLRPARVGDNRYRYYGEEELLRLQQILIHRELGLSLGEISAVLDDPAFDRLESLIKQRDRLEAEAGRHRRMLKTIDRTIAKLKGEKAMKDTDLYSGVVSPQKQAEYESWLIERYGENIRGEIEANTVKTQSMSPTDHAGLMQELKEIEDALAQAMQDGAPPQARSLDPLIERHRSWVARTWSKPCTPDAYANLANLYEAHADFVERYEAIAKGFGAWLPAAMQSWAKRQEQTC